MHQRRWLYISALVVVIAVAAFLRLYRLDWADVINDEALIGFRSIGIIDFFSSPYQTTPWEWFSPVPQWARLSFHDHPALTFLFQHVSFVLLGVSSFALRLPSALAGVGAIVCAYLFAREMFSARAGLFAAALLSVSSYHVWVSRIGLQESLVIAWWLLALCLFARALRTKRHWQWGIALGLAFLTKYTAAFLVPAFIIFLAITDWSELKRLRFWFGFIVAGVIFSPVIIYNIALYRAAGHFDLQFSYLFGQHVEAWQYLPGKVEAGSFSDRVWGLVPAIYRGLLIPQFVLLVLAGAWLANRLIRLRSLPPGALLVGLSVATLTALLLVIGPTLRFTSMLAPLAAISIGSFVAILPAKRAFIGLGMLCILELGITYNTIFAGTPYGQENFTFSRVRYESQRWGYNDLNEYLEKLVAGRYPKLSFPTKYQFLEDIRKEAFTTARDQGKVESSYLLVYDNSMYETATFWLFHRQLVYTGWPVLTIEDFISLGEGYWRSQGVTDFYYFKTLDALTLFDVQPINPEAATFFNKRTATITPEIIKRPDGRGVFEVYHW